MKNEIIIYQNKKGAIEFKGDYKKETLWANLQQIADLFDIDKSGISRHIKNIYQTGELQQRSTVAKIATVQKEGKREIERNIEYYNLDVMLSVGYRVNSKQATSFRQWATKTLREYITKGFVVDKNRIKNNYSQFLEAIEAIKRLVPAGSNIDSASVLELVNAFADTWLSLDAYDRDELAVSGATRRAVSLTAAQLEKALAEFKDELIRQGETTELFGRERQRESVAGIVGNVMQSFGGQPLYKTVEEKAVHLLYFVVKNHPFVDGNKRSGAFAFVWFLKKADLLEKSKITPPALTALTLLVAESSPKDKERVTGLILMLLKK
ncbi:MAG: virulence protein RhuM/Fic/DOC family protein [Candidatus Falkowbacteria bacterium]